MTDATPLHVPMPPSLSGEDLTPALQIDAMAAHFHAMAVMSQPDDGLPGAIVGIERDGAIALRIHAMTDIRNHAPVLALMTAGLGGDAMHMVMDSWHSAGWSAEHVEGQMASDMNLQEYAIAHGLPLGETLISWSISTKGVECRRYPYSRQGTMTWLSPLEPPSEGSLQYGGWVHETVEEMRTNLAQLIRSARQDILNAVEPDELDERMAQMDVIALEPPLRMLAADGMVLGLGGTDAYVDAVVRRLEGIGLNIRSAA